MKYFNPSYWFKLWVLSAPLFNDKTQGINAKSIDNKKIKDWASNNTTDISLIENQQLNFTNSNITNQPYNLSQTTNQNIDPIYQTELETNTHKHRHEKHGNIHKRQSRNDNDITTPKIGISGADKRDGIQFFSNLKNKIFQFLEKNGIFECIAKRSSRQCWNYFILNKNKYFIVPMSVKNRDFSLVFRTSDLYFQGFINNNNRDYYYFSDAEIISLPNLNNINLGFNGNYNNLIDGHITISWRNTFTAFENLANHNSRRPSSNFREELARIILATSESFRFGRVSRFLLEDEIHYWDNDFYPIVTNWETQTENGLNYMIEHNNLDYFPNENNIVIFSQIMNSNIASCSRHSSKSMRSINDFCYIDNNQYSDLKLYYNHQEKNKIEFHSTYTGDGKISFPIVSAIKGFFLGGIIGKVFFDETILPGPFGFVKNAWTYSSDIDEKNHKTVNLEVNLGQINPYNYKKIEILTDNINDDIYTKVSRGNEAFWGNKLTDCINGNMKYEGNFHCEQYVNLKFYQKNNDYYLRLSAKQYAENHAWLFANDGAMWIGVGKGFRLYNNDNVRKKRNIESNENKWIADFTKSINQEQHLPIDNKPNFSTTNITSL